MKRPRLLIEEWLPAAAIGVECIRERSTGQQPPDKRLHVWWAGRARYWLKQPRETRAVLAGLMRFVRRAGRLR